jgi:hypothetical protein
MEQDAGDAKREVLPVFCWFERSLESSGAFWSQNVAEDFGDTIMVCGTPFTPGNGDPMKGPRNTGKHTENWSTSDPPVQFCPVAMFARIKNRHHGGKRISPNRSRRHDGRHERGGLVLEANGLKVITGFGFCFPRTCKSCPPSWGVLCDQGVGNVMTIFPEPDPNGNNNIIDVAEAVVAVLADLLPNLFWRPREQQSFARKVNNLRGCF